MKAKIKVMKSILIVCVICVVCVVLDPFQLPGKPGISDPRDQTKKTEKSAANTTSVESATRPIVSTVGPLSPLGPSGPSAPITVPPETIDALPYPHPFYDSQILAGAIVNPGIQNINCPYAIDQRKILAVLKILAKYSKNEAFRNEMFAQTELTQSFINGLPDKLTEFNNNPFLADFMASFKCTLSNYLLSFQQQAALERFQIYLELTPKEAELPIGTGLLSPTSVIETLSTFIAKRFKEELAILSLKEFIFNLDQAKETGWGLLFPSTISFLSETVIYDFKIFLPTLNAVFIDDLNNIDTNLLDYFLKKRELLMDKAAPRMNVTTNILIPQNESLINFSIFILEMNKCIRTGEHPSGIFSRLNQSKYINQIDERIANPIRLMAMVNRALVNKTMNGWVSPAEFNILLYDFNEKYRDLFVGLIYAKEKDEMEKITFAGKSLKDILAGNEKLIIDMMNYMYKYTIVSETIQAQINILRYVGRLEPTEFHNYLDIIYNLVDFGLELKAFNNDIPYDPTVKKEYLEVLKDLMSVSRNVIDTNYGLAIVNIVKVLNTMQIEDANSIKRFMRYGDFMVSMVASETALDMGKVLEAVAMPVGGYRITRVSPFSFCICSYAGVAGGREILTTQEKLKDKKARWNLSPAAPVGVSFSIGRGTFDKPGPSLSLFIPIIDVGAPFSWRLGGADKGIPELSWKNIFAPGAYIMFGIKNSPISIGAGIQYGPQLRKIYGENDTSIESSAFRVQMLLGFEIPIFNIYAKGKKNNR